MKYHYLSGKVGRIVAALLFMISIGVVSSTSVQAQWWPQNRDRDRDYRRDRNQNDDDRYRRDRNQNDDWRYRRNGGGNYSQMAYQQGYQDGIYTGQNDGQRGQSYNPQRSHFYRNGHGDSGGFGRYGNSYQFQQAYRQGFTQGYNEGYQRYGGYNRRSNNGRYSRWPF
jgi:hypothetical protein